MFTPNPSLPTYLGISQCGDKLLIVENVSLGLKQQLEYPVLYGFQLVLVGVDLHNQLVTLLLQVWPLQAYNITARDRMTSSVYVFCGDSDMEKTK